MTVLGWILLAAGVLVLIVPALPPYRNPGVANRRKALRVAIGTIIAVIGLWLIGWLPGWVIAIGLILAIVALVALLVFWAIMVPAYAAIVLVILVAIGSLVNIIDDDDDANADDGRGAVDYSCGDARDEINSLQDAFDEAQAAVNRGDEPRRDPEEIFEDLEDKVAEANAENCKHIPSATSTTTTPIQPAVECANGFTVRLVGHARHRVIPEGFEQASVEEKRQIILDLASHDPVTLMLYHNNAPLALTDPVLNVTDLVEGGEMKDGVCYSERGVRAYNEWSTLWRVARIDPVEAMPPGWRNTGINGDTPTVGEPPTGDTSGIMVTFVDADGQEAGKHGVMDRCANPVTPTPPPAVPPGPTDESPPAQPPGTTPTTVPPPVTTTTVPREEGKDHTKADPRVLVPRSPEPRRDPVPTTAPPPTTPTTRGSTTPTTWEPDTVPEPDSGDGFTTTVPTPTTVAPPPAPPITSSPPVTVVSD